MGGSGRGYFHTQPEKILTQLKEAEGTTRDQAYEVAVADFLADLLQQFNDRNVDTIRKHLAEIETALQRELAGTVDLIFGGSVSKRTYVEGLSDIDALVMLDSCRLADGDPESARRYFAEQLRRRFPKTAVREGTLAVSISFDDAEIQLLPAVSCRNHVKIADATGRAWAEIRPREFANFLSAVNQQQANKVVPVVKLAKAIIGSLPEQHRITGYHTESLAASIFREYAGERRPKDMLRHFFEEGARRVLVPLKDRTGQSIHVDDSLGPANSLDRRIVADSLARVARRMKNADIGTSLDGWANLFDAPESK